MKRISDIEQSFLTMLSGAGGRHRFTREDKVSSEMHRMLRSLDRRGYITVEEENGVTTVTLTNQGQEEANG